MPNQILKAGSLAAEPGPKTFGVNELPVQGQPYPLPIPVGKYWLIYPACGSWRW